MLTTGIGVFPGTIHGQIIPVPRGPGVRLRSIFEVSGRTLAELPLEEKSRMSHRALALTAFRDWFVQEVSTVPCRQTVKRVKKFVIRADRRVQLW